MLKLSCSKLEKMIDDMRKPEMTKKISTPMKPPAILSGNAWNPTIDRTAKARKPSISARYFDWFKCAVLWGMWRKS